MEIIYSNLSFTKVTQNLENLKSNFNFPKRSYEHKYKSNNWIKMHGKAMRRKPFKKVNAVVMMDEANEKAEKAATAGEPESDPLSAAAGTDEPAEG